MRVITGITAVLLLVSCFSSSISAQPRTLRGSVRVLAESDRRVEEVLDNAVVLSERGDGRPTFYLQLFRDDASSVAPPITLFTVGAVGLPGGVPRIPEGASVRVLPSDRGRYLPFRIRPSTGPAYLLLYDTETETWREVHHAGRNVVYATVPPTTGTVAYQTRLPDVQNADPRIYLQESGEAAPIFLTKGLSAHWSPDGRFLLVNRTLSHWIYSVEGDPLLDLRVLEVGTEEQTTVGVAEDLFGTPVWVAPGVIAVDNGGAAVYVFDFGPTESGPR